ncbi:MAG: Zn-ribbon domain-containing OB-fold protein [Calditrichaeota bacterium]|nr:Zn-ribbon domain-containing OB-fold protein [Calditrichota bacterium]
MKIRSPRYAREIPRRYRYEGAKTTSGEIFFPPRVVYPGGAQAEPHTLATTGKVITWTVLHVAPPEYTDLTPFALGVIELDDGARITAQIADIDPKEVQSGMRVKIEFRKLRTEGDEGLLCYGYKVVPER